MFRSFLSGVALALLASVSAGCSGGTTTAALPDPPPIVAPMPTAPVPADDGQPGTWSPVPGVEPAARAFVVEPAGSDPFAGILLVHTEWGVDPDLRLLARTLAGKGLAVAAADLYDGVEATTRIGSQELLAGVSRARANAILTGTLAHLRGLPKMNGRPVAVLGVAYGGAWAYALGAGGAAIDGLVLDTTPIYLEPDLPGRIRGPVMMLAGSESASLSGERRQEIEDAFRRPDIRFEWRTVPDAGVPLLDRRALGFNAATYDVAVEAVVQFARGLATAR